MEIKCKNNGLSISIRINCPENVDRKFQKTYHCKTKQYVEFGNFNADRSLWWDRKQHCYVTGREFGTKYRFFDEVLRVFEATTHILEFKHENI